MHLSVEKIMRSFENDPFSSFHHEKDNYEQSFIEFWPVNNSSNAFSVEKPRDTYLSGLFHQTIPIAEYIVHFVSVVRTVCLIWNGALRKELKDFPKEKHTHTHTPIESDSHAIVVNSN